jgi:transcriptional regulator with XRE-family HTH domain
VLKNNEFGELVKAYRKQRGWTQEELAERWGHARGYLAQIEGGKRKLDSTAQLIRLADILDIPQEKLEAIGRGIPERKKSAVKGDNSVVLQMLLSQGKDKVRLSWIAWIADQHPAIERSLRDLVFNLDQLLLSYRGEFLKPAQQLLAYAHQMQGKIAYDRVDYAAASGHFSEMIDIGNGLNDADIITLGMSYQGSLLRKRGRYDAAFRCLEAAKPFADVASLDVQGMRQTLIARTYYNFGDEQGFTRSIDSALEIASHTQDSISSLANEFTLDEVLQEQAGGFTVLGKPEKALEIYKEADRLHPFRPLRALGAYTIDVGKTYLYAGDLNQGIQLSLKGVELASEYRSKRHIDWIDQTYNRLRVLPIGKDKRLNTLRDALLDAQKVQAEW